MARLSGFRVLSCRGRISTRNPNATFAYNGDGARVRSTINGVTTLYAGAIEYEIDGSTTTLTKHYDAGGQRVAVRNGASLNYLLNDHLGSTSVILKTNGALWGELRYSAWGETRYSNGTIVTDRQYTGQVNDGATGLYYYNARYYDPALHRFIQADTIVPDPNDPQTLNRFSYVNNNPVIYADPTGHYPCAFCDGTTDPGSGIGYAGQEMVDYSDVGPGASSVQGSMSFNAARLNVDLNWGGKPLAPQIRQGDEIANATILPKPSGAGCSFSADTPVMTIEGNQPISELEIGEWVVAYNEATGETGYYPIVAVWEHLDLQIVLLRIEGELIETTPEHPFFTADGEWVAAGDLEIGTRLQSAEGDSGVVENLIIVHDPQPMYNLTVDVAHTFTVGEGQWIVHNDGCGENVLERLRQQATNLVNRERNNALSIRQRPSMVSVVYDNQTGEYYEGVSGTSPKIIDPRLQERIPLITEPARHGQPAANCAEFNACNSALLDGADPSNLSIFTMRVDDYMPWGRCSNCQTTLPNEWGWEFLTD